MQYKDFYTIKIWLIIMQTFLHLSFPNKTLLLVSKELFSLTNESDIMPKQPSTNDISKANT